MMKKAPIPVTSCRMTVSTMPEIITKLNVKDTSTFLSMVRNGHKLIFTHRIMKFAGIGWMSLNDAPSCTNFEWTSVAVWVTQDTPMSRCPKILV